MHFENIMFSKTWSRCISILMGFWNHGFNWGFWWQFLMDLWPHARLRPYDATNTLLSCAWCDPRPLLSKTWATVDGLDAISAGQSTIFSPCRLIDISYKYSMVMRSIWPSLISSSTMSAYRRMIKRSLALLLSSLAVATATIGFDAEQVPSSLLLKMVCQHRLNCHCIFMHWY